MNEPYIDTTEYTHFLRFLEGDQQSLAWLHQQFHPALLRRGLQILPDEFAVSTAIQDAFLRAWTLRPRMQSPRHLYCFLRLVTRWGCLDWYKRPENKLIQVGDPHLLASIKDDVSPIPFEQPPTHHQQQEMLDIIYKVLPCLPPSRQTILTLHFKYGLSHAQIARRYASSNTAIHHELQKGLDQLKRIIHTQKRLAKSTVINTLPEHAERALSKQELELYRMRREEKMEFSDIAARMGMPQSAVQQQYVQACVRMDNKSGSLTPRSVHTSTGSV